MGTYSPMAFCLSKPLSDDSSLPTRTILTLTMYVEQYSANDLREFFFPIKAFIILRFLMRSCFFVFPQILCVKSSYYFILHLSSVIIIFKFFFFKF